MAARTSVCMRSFFFFNDPATTEIYTLSLHDALPISTRWCAIPGRPGRGAPARRCSSARAHPRSEEHTSELQSHLNLVCRLLLEKKKIIDRRTVNDINKHTVLARHTCKFTSTSEPISSSRTFPSLFFF